MKKNSSEIKSLCVYCGSADGLHQDYYEAAYKMGNLLAENSITLIYGAGKTGLMGAVADGVLDKNGVAIGIVPENLNEPQLIHGHLTKLEVVENIHLTQSKNESPG